MLSHPTVYKRKGQMTKQHKKASIVTYTLTQVVSGKENLVSKYNAHIFFQFFFLGQVWKIVVGTF